MKIYLILKYNYDGANIWADVEAFTSPRERDDAFYARKNEHPEWDMETQDLQVTKRPYKRAAKVEDIVPDLMDMGQEIKNYESN